MSNTRSIMSAGMPTPLSLTLRTASSASRRSTSMRPPSGVYGDARDLQQFVDESQQVAELPIP